MWTHALVDLVMRCGEKGETTSVTSLLLLREDNGEANKFC